MTCETLAQARRSNAELALCEALRVQLAAELDAAQSELEVVPIYADAHALRMDVSMIVGRIVPHYYHVYMRARMAPPYRATHRGLQGAVHSSTL